MGITDARLAMRLKQPGRAASYILSEGLDRGWSTQEPLRCRPACFLPASGQAAEVKVNDGRGVEGQQLTQRKADNGVTSGRRSSEPAPKLSISGMPPSSAAIVVIMIGRNRSRQARVRSVRLDRRTVLRAFVGGDSGRGPSHESQARRPPPACRRQCVYSHGQLRYRISRHTQGCRSPSSKIRLRAEAKMNRDRSECGFIPDDRQRCRSRTGRKM
jgi:hypothetical protein